MKNSNGIRIFSTRPSNGAIALRNALRELGIPVRRIREHDSARVSSGDLLVNWGESYHPAKGLTVLNENLPDSKLHELEVLHLGACSVPKFSTTPKEGWLPRSRKHQEGRDLERPPTKPDFWVERLSITREFRLHIWKGLSIRAGIKVPGEDAHEWIRSHRLGWRYDYGRPCQERIGVAHRVVAKAAMKALGMDFGAVDVAELRNGSVLVLEVNSAPGLEGETTAKYAEKLLKEWKSVSS